MADDGDGGNHGNDEKNTVNVVISNKNNGNPEKEKKKDDDFQERQRKKTSPHENRFWLARIVFLRYLGFIYLVAFMIAFHQNEALIGDHGLTPATRLINSVKDRFSSPKEAFFVHPTLFWFVEPTTQHLQYCALLGAAISFFIVVMGCANSIMMFILWISYFSIVNVGQTWYSFGWESLLLEVGFLSMFMVPWLHVERFPKLTPTPWVGIWGNRWLLFRLMLGAGLIKIRGDECWRNLTCMNYHYLTQPVPNPFSVYFHSNPEWFHKAETMVNHIVELPLPFLALIPHRKVQIFQGVIQILFQLTLICTGNYAYLNWLTITPALMSLDDEFLKHFFSKEDCLKAIAAEKSYRAVATGYGSEEEGDEDSLVVKLKKEYFTYSTSFSSFVIILRRLTTLSLVITLSVLSYPVVKNLISPNQVMNANFDPFRIVNTHGLFGSITKIRHEVILQGTTDKFLTHQTKWLEFEFRCKPGDINRKQCIITPYHLRMDWLMWFAAFQNYQQCSWLVHLSHKLLSGDRLVNDLLDPKQGNPFYNSSMAVEVIEKRAPRYVRAMLYEYRYTSLNETENEEDRRRGWEVGRYWKRKVVGEYMPAIDRNNPSVIQFLQGYGMM